MELYELHTVDEMMETYEVLLELYPSLSKSAYREELLFMINHNYSQVAVKEGDEWIGVSGVWIGNKLWCGKYLEVDNIVVAEKARSSGAGKLMMDFLHAKAKQLSCNMMALDSYTTNHQAHKFFYNQGFGPKGFHFIKVLADKNIR